ncbi:carbohydrate-binding protein [Formosa sp. PL04]|uniref:carbohydrate-binding protein n=1 Tax=Formosa sp. PL04 TaxID=3081755 RepID=UPI002982812A|nr:carbohydrate-binding protein [Formosa sp. PL04]MDW5290270.1 carbohydrate-binding protein [Formosa sp. PL04]
MDCKKLPLKFISNAIKALSFVLIFAASLSASAQDCPTSYPFLEAQYASSMSDALVIQENETVGNVETASWLAFLDQDINCADGINISAAAPNGRGYVEIRLGSIYGTLIGTSDIINTGNWNSFVTVSVPVNTSGISENQDVYFVFVLDPEVESRYLFNIDAFQFTNSQPLSVGDVDALSVSVYPNPTTDFLSINLEKNNLNIAQTKVALFNVAGQKVMEMNASSSKLEMNVSKLSSGIYILNVKDNAKSVSKRIVKL